MTYELITRRPSRMLGYLIKEKYKMKIINMMDNLALAYWERGISCIPCPTRTKTPAVAWKHLQNAPLTQVQIEQLFAEHDGNLAFLTGKPSGNLACIDCEDKELYKEYKGIFTKQYGETWCVTSHRGGHIYFCTTHPIRGHTYCDTGRKWEIRGQSQYVMAPPSIHPDGTDYLYESQPYNIPTVDNLALPNFPGFEFWQPPLIEAPVPRLSNPDFSLRQCYEAFNAKRDSGKKYDTLSGFDFAVILALVNKGVAFETIRQAFRTVNLETHYRRVQEKAGLDAADQNLYHSYKTATAKGDSIEYKEMEALAQRLWEIVYPMPWSGRTALTDRHALLAHIKKFRICKKPIWNLSEREGAEFGEMTHGTFGASTKRLIKIHGYLKFAAPPDKVKMHSTAYEFTEKLLGLPYPQLNTVWICSDKQQLEPETYGVFERRVLGKAAKQVWLTVRENSLTKAAIAKATGLNPGTVTRAVKKLEDYSIVFQVGKLVTANPHYDFKKLSDNLEAGEIGRQREATHQADRERHQCLIQNYRDQHRPTLNNIEPQESAPTNYSSLLLPEYGNDLADYGGSGELLL